MIVNTDAGNTQRRDLDTAVDVLARDGSVEVAQTADVDELDAAFDRADGRTIVVAGGDGSVHLAVGRLHARGDLDRSVLGLIPLGTGNDLARGLDLPLEAADAAEVIVGGYTRRLDLLVDDIGGVAVNAVHAGLGAEAAERSADIKEGLGPLAYPIGALLAATREDGWELRVHVDGDPLHHELPVLMVGVANGPTIGGGTPLCPPAVHDDGRLDVVVVTATAPAARAAFGEALRRGAHLDRGDVNHRRGRTVTIHGQPVRFNADGEISESTPERRYDLAAAAWRFRLPE